jgi:uncharacterized protein YkwD
VFFVVPSMTNGGKVTPMPTISPTVLVSVVPTELSTPSAIPSTFTPSPTVDSQESVTVPDIPTLQQFMLDLINDDRRSNGLSEVGWDDIAANAGLRHAQEMARYDYLSHWDLEGHGPDYRYSMVGGTNCVRENVYISSGIAPVTLDDWKELIRQAEQALMESPGHRDNILSPEHTHVGIGIAYETDAAGGRLTIAQEFVNKYLTLQPVLHRVSLGSSLTLAGKLGSGLDNPYIDLAYESFPTPMSVEDLNNTDTYVSPAESYDGRPLDVDSSGRFSLDILLDNGGLSGIYHIRISGDTEFGRIMVADIVVEVK